MATDDFPPPFDHRDPFIRHEILDRASVVADLFESHLQNMPGVQADPLLKVAAQRAMDALSDFHMAAAQDPA